jgi:hypothetical protein
MNLYDAFHHPDKPKISTRQLAGFLLLFERAIMSDIDTIQAQVAELSAAVTAANGKVDTLIAQNEALVALTDSIAAALTAAGNAGQIPPDTLSMLLNRISDAKSIALAIGDKADAETARDQATISQDSRALPPPPAPAPAPAAGDGSASSGDGAPAPGG